MRMAAEEIVTEGKGSQPQISADDADGQEAVSLEKVKGDALQHRP
jgi:hypothetical protein